MAFREIENLMPMKEPADKTRMFQTDMTMGRDLLGELGIIMNFNDHKVT
jgi:hypothetical protein